MNTDEYAIHNGIIYNDMNIYIYICLVNSVINHVHSLQLQQHYIKYSLSHLYSLITTYNPLLSIAHLYLFD